MKKISSIIAFSLLVMTIQAQNTNEKFVKAMEKGLAGMDTLKTAEQWLNLSNTFERIALKEPKEWLPAYYVAFGQTMAFNMSQESAMQELMAKRAEEFINKADAMMPDNSEIYVLKSMISTLFIRLNPMINGQKYGPIAAMQLEKAIQLDPENPRAYMQKGITLFFTPAQWGGDKEKGKALMETAKTKYGTFKPESSIAPAWGEKMNEVILEMANK